MSKIKVEKVNTITPNIVDAFMKLIVVVVPSLKPNHKEIEKNLNERVPSRSSFYLASIDGKYIGMGFVLYQWGIIDIYGKVESVAVLDEYQGMGVGRKLMEQIISDAHNMKLEYLELTSAPSRQAANHLYKTLGFQLISKAGETNYYRYYTVGGFR